LSNDNFEALVLRKLAKFSRLDGTPDSYKDKIWITLSKTSSCLEDEGETSEESKDENEKEEGYFVIEESG